MPFMKISREAVWVRIARLAGKGFFERISEMKILIGKCAKAFLSALAGTLFVAQCCGAIVPLLGNAPENYVWVAAHRAAWQHAPENSIPALEDALAFGADIIETDVRMTADGHVVIMHDYSVDRTTDGSGLVSRMTLAEIKNLRLKTNWGGNTQFRVPTLDEYLDVAKGKAYLYLDKAGYDLPGNAAGTLIRKLLEILKKHDALESAIFVLDWPYAKAKEVFGEDLERVIYCPVISDTVPELDAYVNEYLEKLKPVAFQFRMASENSKTFRLLPRILDSGSKAFVAATWANHTAGHDDRASFFDSPDNGWGWLTRQGFSLIETNFPRDLINYLRAQKKRSRAAKAVSVRERPLSFKP